jgi:ATP-dependent helicase/nuclease subunit B
VAAPRLSEDLARRFYPPGRSLRLSVSQLEQFAECPLKYFMHYAMGLRPREILELDSLNLGTLYHRILERVYQKVVDGELRWPECEPAALKKVLDEEVDAACEELHEELAARTPGYDQMRARTKRTLGIVLEGERRRARSGDLRPLGVEVIFGGSRASAKQSAAPGTKSISLPVLQIATPGGARVELNGKIDRVDASQMGVGTMAAVIDYKSARYMSLDLSRVYHGLSLQLSVYALVMRELRGMQPIAALYLPLGLARRRARSIAKGAQEPGPDSDDFYRKNKPHGVVDAAAIAHLDRVSGDDAESKSGWYSIGFNKKEPKVPTRTDMLLHGDFATLMEFVRWKIGAMADDLMAGHIAPAPYREKKNTPCQYCDFVSLCPFDRASGVFRVMPKLERQEAVNKMRAAIAGKGEGA